MTAQKNFRTDSFVSGLAIKAPVKAASNAPLTLSGEQTVNGIPLLVGDRVLVKDQADPIENGIYVVETSAWQRAGDWDGERDVVGGSVVPAYDQTAGAFIQWIVDGAGASLSPAVDSMTFTQFYDPVGTGTSIPVSTQLSAVLRADGAGGWLEETDLRISSTGSLSTSGSISLSDGVDQATFNAATGDLTLAVTGGFGHFRAIVECRFDDEFYIQERVSAGLDRTGYGQFWVRSSDDAPMFTTEAGVDYQLNTAPSFTAPLVLLDDEEIQFGSLPRDAFMEWTAAGLGGGSGLRIGFDTASSVLGITNAPQIRLYNSFGTGYIQLENTGVLSLNSLQITAAGGTSNITVPFGLVIDIDDNRFLGPVLDDYAIQHATAGSVAGALDIDFEDGNSHYLALTENVTSMTLSNPPVSGRLGQVEIEILQDSVARTIAWPASVKWPGGTAPDLSTINSTHIVHLRTRDGGTTYLGSYLENFS